MANIARESETLPTFGRQALSWIYHGLPAGIRRMRAEDFIRHHPELYHVARADAWPSIASRGLLSASAALDHFGILGTARARFESMHRSESMSIFPGHPTDIVLRDQKTMPPERLQAALFGTGLTPEDWYRTMNAKVFFWASWESMYRSLRTFQQRGTEHDVLVVSTASLVFAHPDDIMLSHIESGSTVPIIRARDALLFQPISRYPVFQTGRPRKRVLEAAVEHGVTDIAQHVVDVLRMRGGTVIRRIAA
jgi:hypothetical protein